MMRAAVLIDKRELPVEVDTFIEELLEHGFEVDVVWHYLGTVISDWLIDGDYLRVPAPDEVRQVANDFFDGLVPIEAALPVPRAVITAWHDTLVAIMDKMYHAGLGFSDLHFHLDEGFWFNQVMVIEGDRGQELRPPLPDTVGRHDIMQCELPFG